MCLAAVVNHLIRFVIGLRPPLLPISFFVPPSLLGFHFSQHKCSRVWVFNGLAHCLGAWLQSWCQSHLLFALMGLG